MDYEKKYKEALSRARSIIEDYKNRRLNDILSYAQEDLSAIFPELEMSEDERIRKSIIELLNEVHFTFKYYDINKMLTWLEKQGEQKPNTDFSDLRTWKYIVDAVLTEKEGIGQYLDSPFTEEIAKKLQKRFGNIEQKPTWKPSDEQIEALESATENCAYSEYQDCLRELIEQLKKL